jgi:sulfatase maturation enzyme AslB (radical SAM superfamily)
METKKYSSYAQIENDLQILKVEREIQYQKIRLSVDKTKESLAPSKTISFLSNIYENVLSGTVGTIIKTLIPIVINWYFNRKRGD